MRRVVTRRAAAGAGVRTSDASAGRIAARSAPARARGCLRNRNGTKAKTSRTMSPAAVQPFVRRKPPVAHQLAHGRIVELDGQPDEEPGQQPRRGPQPIRTVGRMAVSSWSSSTARAAKLPPARCGTCGPSSPETPPGRWHRPHAHAVHAVPLTFRQIAGAAAASVRATAETARITHVPIKKVACAQ